MHVSDATRRMSGALHEQQIFEKGSYTTIYRKLGIVFSSNNEKDLRTNILKLVEMFCCLFGLKQAGLRLIALDTAMCPNFHVDRVPCRLITTYQGIATEWIPHLAADRSKLDLEKQRQPNEKSVLISCKSDIQQLKKGEVALLKGEAWKGNQGAGLFTAPHNY